MSVTICQLIVSSLCRIDPWICHFLLWSHSYQVHIYTLLFCLCYSFSGKTFQCLTQSLSQWFKHQSWMQLCILQPVLFHYIYVMIVCYALWVIAPARMITGAAFTNFSLSHTSDTLKSWSSGFLTLMSLEVLPAGISMSCRVHDCFYSLPPIFFWFSVMNVFLKCSW